MDSATHMAKYVKDKIGNWQFFKTIFGLNRPQPANF